jgi:hypothetical protein
LFYTKLLPDYWQSRNLIDSPPNKLGLNKDFIMKANTVPPLNDDFEEYFLPWYHLGYVDPVTRRVPRPSEYKNDVKFYDRLMFEATSLMVFDGEVGLCLFEQAYEVARDSDKLGPTECLAAAEELNRRGFSELAYNMFEEIAQKALQENDVETLKSLVFSLWQCRRFSQKAASDLANLILEKHPEVLPPLPKKKKRSK